MYPAWTEKKHQYVSKGLPELQNKTNRIPLIQWQQERDTAEI